MRHATSTRLAAAGLLASTLLPGCGRGGDGGGNDPVPTPPPAVAIEPTKTTIPGAMTETEPGLRVEPTGSNTSGPCEDCGNISQTVWGTVFDGDTAVAVYYVQWTPGHREHDASFDLILGRWGDDSSAKDRSAVSLVYRIFEGKPSFMVIDAGNRPTADSELVGASLTREQVVGTPMAGRAFDVVDAVLVGDDRIAEIAEKPGG